MRGRGKVNCEAVRRRHLIPFSEAGGMSALGTMEPGHALQLPLEEAILQTTPGKLPSALPRF